MPYTQAIHEWPTQNNKQATGRLHIGQLSAGRVYIYQSTCYVGHILARISLKTACAWFSIWRSSNWDGLRSALLCARATAAFASLSAHSFPYIPTCAGICLKRASMSLVLYSSITLLNSLHEFAFLSVFCRSSDPWVLIGSQRILLLIASWSCITCRLPPQIRLYVWPLQQTPWRGLNTNI